MPLTPEGIESIAKAIVATQEKHHHDHDHEHKSNDDDDDRGNKQWSPSKWLIWITPIFLVVLSFAWNSVRVVGDKIDALETRLPLDYVPRAEHVRNAEIDRALTKEREDRVTRIEAKVDRILENQEARQGRK